MSDQALAILLAVQAVVGAFVGWQACRFADSWRAMRLAREACRPAAEWTPTDDDWLDSWGIRP